MNKRLIVALDFPTAKQALSFAGKVSPETCRLKVGFELYIATGPDLVKKLIDKGFDVFLDLKLHDIPNTVAAACLSASKLGIWMLNVHALGGKNMMVAAANAVQSVQNPPRLIAVTVLTSVDKQQLLAIGIQASPQNQVLTLARQAKQCNLDGVVCSAQEATLLRQELGKKFNLVTPGIRPANSSKGDQIRVMTPLDAIRSGASYLVVGRPITQAPDPLAMIASINHDIQSASTPIA